ncbi:hypothetical protein [Streptomyces sp. NPDC001536]|uniref:hypothetical protein n=1 Tax=Streptomyces sp. NPDC001536 TaxID=3364583 RepID=UPI0036853AD7
MDPEPPELTYGTYNGFAYMPAMPGIAYRVLFQLLGTQEPGGRWLGTEEDLAQALRVHRSLAGRGLQALIHARFVERQTKGVYLLNPMISGGRTVAEHLEGIGDLEDESRLDVDDYQERYDEAVELAELEKKAKRLGRTKTPSDPAAEKASGGDSADVLQLSAARRRTRRKS